MPVRAPVNDEFQKPGGELDSLTSKRLSRSRRCRSRRRRGRSLPHRLPAVACEVARGLGRSSSSALGIYPVFDVSWPTKNCGTLEKAAAMANHASTRTMQLYDRRD